MSDRGHLPGQVRPDAEVRSASGSVTETRLVWRQGCLELLILLAESVEDELRSVPLCVQLPGAFGDAVRVQRGKPLDFVHGGPLPRRAGGCWTTNSTATTIPRRRSWWSCRNRVAPLTGPRRFPGRSSAPSRRLAVSRQPVGQGCSSALMARRSSIALYPSATRSRRRAA